MATHNGAAWVAEQIGSIAAQRGPFRVALAVCDDASTDETVDAVEESAAATGLPLTWVRSSLPGGGAGRNFFRLLLSVDARAHDYVALADQDDVWCPGKLARAIDRLSTSGAAALSAPVRAFWADGRQAVLRQSARTTDADHLFEGAGQGCTFVFSGPWFERLQGEVRRHWPRLQAVHYHDWAIYAVARCHGERWHFDDRLCLDYRQHAANDTGARTLGSGARKRLALIRSGWYGRQVRAIAMLCAAIDAHEASLPARYLRLLDRVSREGWFGRLRLALFVCRHGRRRWSDRAVVAWAALAGHLDHGQA